MFFISSYFLIKKIKYNIMNLKTNAEIAKEMVNKVYQPTGFLKHNENSNTMWEWSKNRVVEFLDYIINISIEGSSN